MLGNSPGDAPPGVWDLIAAQLDPPPVALESVPDTSMFGMARPATTAAPGRADAPASIVVPFDASTRPRGANRSRPARREWATRLVLAAAAIVIAVLAVTVVRQDRELGRRPAPALDMLVTSALNEPGSHVADLVSTDGRVRVRAVISSHGDGYLLGGQLPALPAGRVYQLWAVQGDKVLSVGVLGRDPDTKPFAADEAWAQLVITEERSPGVVQSAGPAVVVGKIA